MSASPDSNARASDRACATLSDPLAAFGSQEATQPKQDHSDSRVITAHPERLRTDPFQPIASTYADVLSCRRRCERTGRDPMRHHAPFEQTVRDAHDHCGFALAAGA